MAGTVGLALRVLLATPAIAMLVLATAPACAGTQRWRDDQIPFGPAGTIGRGTDSAAYPPYNVRGGIPLFTFSRGDEFSDPEGRWSAAPKVPHRYGRSATGGTARDSGPVCPPSAYLTNQYLEPGDGYRYPLYFNPGTRTYFYYPARR